MNILVFDIETIPDLNTGRRLYGLEGLSDQEMLEAIQVMRRQKTNGSDFVQHHLQQVVAISLILRFQNTIKVWSIGDESSDEKELIERFFKGIDKYTPMLVSWNGAGFDLPVLHYRALYHKVSAAQYWETGDGDTQFRWNNYLNRFHNRHLDLMDVLAGYQLRSAAPLDHIATMLGYPGKMGMDGGKVAESFLNGRLNEIRNYCETDVLNTYLVYLRFELMRANLLEEDYQNESELLKDYLEKEDKPHFKEFLEAWQA